MTVRKPLTAALVASVDDIEAQFYEAMQQADIDKLMAVWSDDEDVYCVHPGGPRLVGHEAIRNAFDSIFSNGAVAVAPTNVKRVEHHGTAVHNVLERVEVPGEQGPQVAWVIATNVYVKTTQGWRLVAHHASPGNAREPSEVRSGSSALH
jgi:uncharacterized protein (TIGR02246 family)